MIPFRHHVVSLVAVFLALAAGVALGGGPLTDLGRTAPTRTQPAAAVGDQADARQADFAEAVLAAGATRLAADGLRGRTVALVSFPGASSSTAEALVGSIEAAGGAVTGQYAVQPALVNAGEKTLVDTLGSQLLTQLDRSDLDAEAPTYVRMGELMALAVGAVGKGRGPVTGDGSSVGQSLVGAELMQPVGESAGRASYVVMLLGTDTDAADDPIYTGLVSGLAARAGAVVLSASAADGVDGRLSRLRGDEALAEATTVDGVDAISGQLTTVLALAQWPATRGAAFGATGADGAVVLR